jgi:hypothetical protein
MSILLRDPRPVEKLEIKTKPGEPRTSSILLVSVAIFLTVVLLMYVGILFTEGSIKSYSACREKIIGYEQRGQYTSPEQFKMALSNCEPR